MEQLIKQACDLYDWVALLWAAFGEFLARNGSPPSIIGGHSFYFRLQDPVLDKSVTTSSHYPPKVFQVNAVLKFI